jgi:oligosaccharide repeat unit polymerase
MKIGRFASWKKLSSTQLSVIIGYISIYLLAMIVYTKSGFIEQWANYGFQDEYSFWRVIITLAGLCLLSCILPLAPKFSVISMHIALLLIIIPSFLLYACAGASNYFIWVTICGYTTFAILTKSKYKFLNINRNQISFPKIDIPKIIFVAVMSIIIAVYSKVGTKGINFNLLEVYEYRAEIKNSFPKYLLYLIPWASKVMIPFCTVIALEKRRYLLSFLSIICGVILFSLTGQKSTLFLTLLIPIFYYLIKIQKKKPQVTILSIVLILNTALIASFLDFHQDYIFNKTLIGTFFFRRALLIPSLLNSFYIETFGTSESFRYFFENIPYLRDMSTTREMPIPNIIGMLYFNSVDTSANTGWIGSGFAQAGYLGVILYSSLLAFFCRIGDIFAEKHGLHVCFCVLAGPLLAMITSSDTLTALLTHGGGLALILLLILPQQNHANLSRG